MYSSQQSYGYPPPELSNNPFIDHSANAMARFPDISGSDDPTSSQYTSWLNHPSTSSLNPNPTGYHGNQGTMSPQAYSGAGYQAQPQPTGWGQQNSGFSQPQQQQPYGQALSPVPVQTQVSGMPFQPTSSFGQQLQAHVHGAYGGVPQQQPQPQSQPQPQQQPQQQYGYAQPQGYAQVNGYQQGYPGQQQQQYLSEFDPYAAATQPQNAISTSMPSIQGAAGSGIRKEHPREFLTSHKAELEGWDTYSWKQIQNLLEDLKQAWEARKRELEGRLRALGSGGPFGSGFNGLYGSPAQQYVQLESMAKDATMHIDSIAASSFQMQEVFSGYRLSNDIASKRRVREAINAAFTSLPEWPQPLGF